MNSITLTTPTLLFSAISLLFLAYTNRFLAIAKVIRELHKEINQYEQKKDVLTKQIENLYRRITYIRQMQIFGVLSFALCILSMIFVIIQNNQMALILFILSLIILLISLLIALKEIYISASALNVVLGDIVSQKKLFSPDFLTKGKQLYYSLKKKADKKD